MSISKAEYESGLGCRGLCSLCADTEVCYQYKMIRKDEEIMDNTQKTPLYIVTYYEIERKSNSTWVFKHETYTNPGTFIEKVRHLTDNNQKDRYKDIKPGIVEQKPLSIEKVLNPFG